MTDLNSLCKEANILKATKVFFVKTQDETLAQVVEFQNKNLIAIHFVSYLN